MEAIGFEAKVKRQGKMLYVPIRKADHSLFQVEDIVIVTLKEKAKKEEPKTEVKEAVPQQEQFGGL